MSRHKDNNMTADTKFYTRQGLWSLFLMCAFPLHIWTIVLAFRDFSWISERTNSWDAVGVTAYGLLFALLESIGYFIAAGLAGFLVSPKWEEKRRIALISVLAVILALWGMTSQLFFLWEIPVSDTLVEFLIKTGRPLVSLYTIAFLIVSLTIIVPTWRILVSSKAYKMILEGIDRLSTLVVFYLVFDVIAILIIIIRNF